MFCTEPGVGVDDESPREARRRRILEIGRDLDLHPVTRESASSGNPLACWWSPPPGMPPTKALNGPATATALDQRFSAAARRPRSVAPHRLIAPHTRGIHTPPDRKAGTQRNAAPAPSLPTTCYTTTAALYHSPQQGQAGSRVNIHRHTERVRGITNRIA